MPKPSEAITAPAEEAAPRLRVVSGGGAFTKVSAKATPEEGMGPPVAEKEARGAPPQKQKPPPKAPPQPGGVTHRERIEQARKPEENAPWLPAGSMIQGVLLNGMDAPSSATAVKNPTPALIRVKREAVLPNRYRMDVKECFIIASGYGVMSSERAIMRTESLTCIRRDGRAIEAPLEGYVIGEDGKVGMRGRLVTKQGQMIARSLVAGVLSGLGKSLTPQSLVGVNINPSSGTIETQQPALSTVLQGGAYQGVGTALDGVAKFYLDMAKEMFPVIEVDAGRKITVVVIRGGSLGVR
ncbi:MAG: hypothetical protein D6819_10575 [Gammaproteobacteria bacterium]|nr:MAG: hypothetical protein D6819_10575 [Gammaproteobacteria bacterium]